MGRRKIDNPKGLRIEIRVTPSQKSRAEMIASLKGITVSDLLRSVIEQSLA